MHSWGHADSEYVLHVVVDHKGAEFTSNKHIHRHIYIIISLLQI